MTHMKVVAYCRVSTDEQVRSGFSLADQEQALRAWCSEHGHELLEVIRDEGHSGAYLERPGLDRVRDLVEAGGVSRSYGVAWSGRHDWKVIGRERTPGLGPDGGGYRDVRRRGEKPRDERERKPWLRDAREAASARERLAKLELVEDRYRDQQAEGLITMEKLREKLDALREEREGLQARLAMLADGERRLRELEELPRLVEEYLRDLPYLVDRMPVIREYETVPPEREPGADGLPPIYTLTPDRIRFLPEAEAAARRQDAEAARGARVRELYARLGLRAAVDRHGTLEITVGATNMRGVMPWDEPG